jgi:anti-sigma factor RsiW
VTTACDTYSAAISELADGALAPAERARVEAHLDQCAGCRELLADLQALRTDARRLPRLEPPAALWPRLTSRLRAEGVSDRRPRFQRSSIAWLGVAAALVAAIGAALLMIGRAPSPGPQATPAQPAAALAEGNVAATELVESVEADLRAAVEHYDRAIAGLEKLAASDQRALDPATAATLKKNLEVIDQAIAESRVALRSEPQSAPARESLFQALQRKMSLLQDTIALMNEMRKGNQAGAAQIVEGLQKS